MPDPGRWRVVTVIRLRRSARMAGARCVLVIAALGVFGWAGIPFAQVTGSAAAQADVERGAAAAGSGQVELAIEAFRRAARTDPTLLTNPDRFFGALRMRYADEEQARARLKTLFHAWISVQPKEAVIHYLLGRAWEPDAEAANRHYGRAVALAPDLVVAHTALARNARYLGENRVSAAEWKAAADLRQDDAQYLLSYAQALAERDLPGWKEGAHAVVTRFPGTAAAVDALFLLGTKATSIAESTALLDRATREFPAANSSMSRNAPIVLFELLARTEPNRARDLAGRMVEEDVQSYVDWKKVLAMQESIVRARQLLDAQRGDEALGLLRAATPAASIRRVPFDLLVIQSHASAGQLLEAHERAADLVAVSPQEDIYRELLQLAERLGRTTSEVKADLRARRESRAVQAEEFELANYLDGSTTSLRTHRGKVVLLNFWYPT